LDYRNCIRSEKFFLKHHELSNYNCKVQPIAYTLRGCDSAASAEWTVTEGVALAFSTEKLTLPSVSFLKKSKIRSRES
jgi:hypothetical protein